MTKITFSAELGFLRRVMPFGGVLAVRLNWIFPADFVLLWLEDVVLYKADWSLTTVLLDPVVFTEVDLRSDGDKKLNSE